MEIVKSNRPFLPVLLTLGIMGSYFLHLPTTACMGMHAICGGHVLYNGISVFESNCYWVGCSGSKWYSRIVYQEKIEQSLLHSNILCQSPKLVIAGLQMAHCRIFPSLPVMGCFVTPWPLLLWWPGRIEPYPAASYFYQLYLIRITAFGM